MAHMIIGLEYMNRSCTFALMSLASDEFQCDNEVLIAGQHLVNDIF